MPSVDVQVRSDGSSSRPAASGSIGTGPSVVAHDQGRFVVEVLREDETVLVHDLQEVRLDCFGGEVEVEVAGRGADEKPADATEGGGDHLAVEGAVLVGQVDDGRRHELRPGVDDVL